MQIAKASVARSMAQNDIAYMKAQSALEHRSSMVNIRKVSDAKAPHKCLGDHQLGSPLALSPFSMQARQDEVRQGQEKQFRETMAAPDFELEDYDW